MDNHLILKIMKILADITSSPRDKLLCLRKISQEVGDQIYAEHMIYMSEKYWINNSGIQEGADRYQVTFSNTKLTALGRDYLEELQNTKVDKQEAIVHVKIVNDDLTIRLHQDTLDELRHMIEIVIAGSDLKEEEKDTFLNHIKNLPKNLLPNLVMEAIKEGIKNPQFLTKLFTILS